MRYLALPSIYCCLPSESPVLYIYIYIYIYKSCILDSVNPRKAAAMIIVNFKEMFNFFCFSFILVSIQILMRELRN